MPYLRQNGETGNGLSQSYKTAVGIRLQRINQRKKTAAYERLSVAKMQKSVIAPLQGLGFMFYSSLISSS